MFNQVMMSLRLVEGLDLEAFKTRYHVSLEDVYPKSLHKHLNNGNLVKEGHYLKTTPASLKYLNSILVDFLEKEES
jgi:oxygen-independent coproporphyrinogen-3 oxidase